MEQQTTDTPVRTFAELGLREAIVKTLSDLGYEAPTPVQERTIPILLTGSDLIGQAQTGTGKTAAFALPMLERLDLAVRKTQGLILAPTRELAMQVAEAFHSYSRGLGDVMALPVYGGAPIGVQMKHLARGAQIVVGTPGRLIDHLDRGTLKPDAVRFVVLDEADEMLKMGFLEDVERILSAIPTDRQIALFSATMPEEVARIAERHLVKPARVAIERKALTAPAIEQRFLNLAEGQKLDVLTQLLELEESDAVLIFRRTKTGAAELAEKLEARGFAAVAMHGDMNQQMRENVIRRLRNGQIEIVVATDVAARGLDVEQITHVVNYDVPYDAEAYVHRIGRTGRAGRSGVATMFVTPRERRMLREIERFTGASLAPMRIPSAHDVAKRRASLFRETLKKTLEEGDLDMYVELIEQVAEEGPFDVVDVAAAAAKLANAQRSLTVAPQPIPVVTEVMPRRESRDRDDRRPPDEGPRVRLRMSVGKNDGIRPADVVGSIANEADIPGRDIGPIDIRDDETYVVIPERFLGIVLEKVGRAKFRGRPVNLRVAGGDDDRNEPPRERKPYTRPPSDAKPYGKPYAKPAAAYGKRPAGPKRFDDRPPAGGPRRYDKPPGDGPRRYDKPPAAGAPRRYDDKPPRRFDDKPPRRFEDKPPRRFDDGPPRGPRKGPAAGGAKKPFKRR